MAKSGAALATHECLKVIALNRGREWAAVCACGDRHYGPTLAAACKKQQQHAEVATMRDTGAICVRELAFVLLVILAALVWMVDAVAAATVLR